MTTLISWITYDQDKQASIYIASDSRLSWKKDTYWNSGRKIYCSNKYPEILGYCGDVLFCSQTISQVITYIDSCDILEKEYSPDKRFDLITELIKRSFGDYPKQFALGSFEIIYVTRIKKYEFAVFSVEWATTSGWKVRCVKIPGSTGLVTASGSGGKLYEKKYLDEFLTSDIGGYSRSYYSCLCSHIKSEADPLTGGPVQISGLFNQGPAVIHGVLMNGRRYFYGMEVDSNVNINNVRWINENFENCDGMGQNRLEGAQPQPLPRNIK